MWHRRRYPQPLEPHTVDDCQDRRVKMRVVGGEAWLIVLVKGWSQSMVGCEVFDGCLTGETRRMASGHWSNRGRWGLVQWC
ncbi:hypothetical protein V6N13_117090 [Hibiscus sabdariffa]|uniref:Uncharacterized protein n=2 Tax=Hibiscus sabdariffa TaxID=183260 RepID=A0ABR1ZWY8_9ROSI